MVLTFITWRITRSASRLGLSSTSWKPGGWFGAVLCFVFVAVTPNSLLSHINSAHSHSPDFRVVCGIGGCTKEYGVYNSLRCHIRRNHHEHLESGCSESRRGRTTTTPSREAASAVRSNAWEYRPADRTVENRARQTGEAMVEIPSQKSPGVHHTHQLRSTFTEFLLDLTIFAAESAAEMEAGTMTPVTPV